MMVKRWVICLTAFVCVWGGGSALPEEARGEPSARSKTPGAAGVVALSERQGETPVSERSVPVVEIVSGLEWESVVYQVEIRNAGDEPVDMRHARPRTAAGNGASKERLTLVRGSFELCPGERALIITHAAIDPNDTFRAEFANVYAWIRNGPDAVTLDGGGVTLLDDQGIVLADSDTTMFTVVGKCCTNPSGNCACDGINCNSNCMGACWPKIGQARCCNQGGLDACCFAAGDTTSCASSGCPAGALPCL